MPLDCPSRTAVGAVTYAPWTQVQLGHPAQPQSPGFSLWGPPGETGLRPACFGWIQTATGSDILPEPQPKILFLNIRVSHAWNLLLGQLWQRESPGEADPAPLDRGLDFSMEPPCPREAQLPAGGGCTEEPSDNPPMGPFSG